MGTAAGAGAGALLKGRAGGTLHTSIGGAVLLMSWTGLDRAPLASLSGRLGTSIRTVVRPRGTNGITGTSTRLGDEGRAAAPGVAASRKASTSSPIDANRRSGSRWKARWKKASSPRGSPGATDEKSGASSVQIFTITSPT